VIQATVAVILEPQKLSGCKGPQETIWSNQLLKAGSSLNPDQVALVSVQLGSENLQGQKFHRLSLPLLSYPHNKTCFPCIQSETSFSPFSAYDPNLLFSCHAPPLTGRLFLSLPHTFSAHLLMDHHCQVLAFS